MKRPIEHEYNSFVSYARELEKYCDWQESEIERLRAALTGIYSYSRCGRTIDAAKEALKETK